MTADSVPYYQTMGLEVEELVINLEEEFEIAIPDEVASVLTTSRMLIDWIAAHPDVSRQWSRGYVEETVWLAIEHILGVRRQDFTDDSRVVQDMGAG